MASRLPFWTPSIYRSTTLRMLVSSGQRVLMMFSFFDFPCENQSIVAANLSKLLFVGLTRMMPLACGSMVLLFFVGHISPYRAKYDLQRVRNPWLACVLIRVDKC